MNEEILKEMLQELDLEQEFIELCVARYLLWEEETI